MSSESSLRKFMIVMGLAVGLPSTILGLFFVLYQLVKNDVISWNTLLVILIVGASYPLVLMVKYVLGPKDKQ